jgi:predicted small integral membrane protein
MNIELLTLCIVICGYALWFSLAVFNNITDFQTNKFLIAKMISMEDIISDPNLGNRLQWRALQGKHWPTLILGSVIFYQIIVAAKIVFTGITLVGLVMSGGDISTALLNSINIALLMMLVLWFGFLIGGLWFGYWMKMPQVQFVHLLLVLITLMCIALTNTI